MKELTHKYMKENNLITNNAIVCATSGGVDSVCLLHILKDLGFSVILAHVNHNKRKESKDEMEAMRKLASNLSIPFEYLSYHYDESDNFHNQAHNARYDFFKSVCDKYNTNVIATAHHLDDQIETVIIKIINGSNLYGYGGISPYYQEDGYKIIRPLLFATKEMIYEYANINNYLYFEDSSNSEDDYLRNRIRHHVVPLLKENSNDIYNKITSYSNQIKDAFNFIRTLSIKYLNENNNKIELNSYHKLDVALQKDIISLLLEKYNIEKNYRVVMQIHKLLQDKTGNSSLNLNGGYIFIKEYDKAYLSFESNNKLERIIINDNDSIIYGNKYKIYFSKTKPQNNAKHIKLCYNDIVLPLSVRPWQNGDSIKMQFGTKKINRLFIDNKIPSSIRNQIPVIVDNTDKILWVYDLAKDELIAKHKNLGELYLVCEVINYE
jgi:tRNA(Ile)-lysidine synthetase-like protein